MPDRIKADLGLLLVAVLWGSAFAAMRVAAQLGSVYYFNGARFMLAAALLAPFGQWSRVKRHQWRWMCTAGIVLFIASALQQLGLLTTSASNGGFLTSLYVVLVPFIVFIGWRKRPGMLAVVAVLLAATGAFLLSTGGQLESKAGDALEFAGAAFWAAHVVILGKFAPGYDAISFSTGQLLVGSAPNWLAGVFGEPLPWPVHPALLYSIVYTAVISLALGYTLQIWGQKHTPPTDAAIILSLEAVFAAIAGGLLLGERLLPLQTGGCALIVLAVVLSQVGGWSRIQASIRSPDTTRVDGDIQGK